MEAQREATKTTGSNQHSPLAATGTGIVDNSPLVSRHTLADGSPGMEGRGRAWGECGGKPKARVGRAFCSQRPDLELT